MAAIFDQTLPHSSRIRGRLISSRLQLVNFNQAPAQKQAQSLPSSCTWQLDRASGVSWAPPTAQDAQRADLSGHWERGDPRCTNVAGEADVQHEEGGAAPDRELLDKAPSCLTGSSTACRMYSELISAAIGSGGPHAARTSQVKLMRSVKKVALRLIETFVDKAEDTAVIAQQFVPAMMDPILGDYARNVPDARWASPDHLGQ